MDKILHTCLLFSFLFFFFLISIRSSFLCGRKLLWSEMTDISSEVILAILCPMGET